MKKFLSAIICLFMLFTIVACTASQAPQTQETFQTSEKSQTPQKTQPPQEDPDSVYDGIIEQYSALITDRHNGKELFAPSTDGMNENEAAIAIALHGIVDACKDAESVKNLGYGYKDVDGNGINELLIMTKYASLKAILTVSDNKPILLEANYGEGTSFSFATRNRFLMKRNTVTDNLGEMTFYTCHVDGDKMVYDAIYGDVYDNEKLESLEKFQMVDGKRTLIDQETFNDLNREQKQLSLTTNPTIPKLLAPRIYFPLENNAANENLPVADFSSYAAIRETCKAISACLDEFSVYSWLMGEYDDIFAFPNNLSFEYYTHLLYTTYCGGFSSLGYDEIDINGDGQDELLLLDEDYSIKAIFTQKNGKPVLLDAFGYGTCWIDDQGFIHVDREDYYELEYSLYEFTKSGDYNFVYSILVADNGNRYLTKNGKTERITFEHSLELYYDEYCRYSEPFTPKEQTRNVTNLTYTTLTETTEDLVKAAKDKTWHKNADMEKTTGKDLAVSNTYITFENVTDTRIDVNFKYAFTFLYPDPNDEHSLLNNTTESTLKITASAKDGVFVFDESGIKGRLEFGYKYLWLVIEESTDERFAVGYHCYDEFSPHEIIS